MKPNYTNHPQMPYQSFFMNCVYKSCVRKCVLQQFRPCVKTWPMGLSRKQVPASEILMCSAGITGGCREDDGLPWTCRFTVFNQFRTFPFPFSCFVLFFQDPTLEFLRKFGIGFVSGTMGSVFNIPFDVAKSRIQGPQPVPGEIKYRNCFQTMATVYQEEG